MLDFLPTSFLLFLAIGHGVLLLGAVGYLTLRRTSFLHLNRAYFWLLFGLVACLPLLDLSLPVQEVVQQAAPNFVEAPALPNAEAVAVGSEKAAFQWEKYLIPSLAVLYLLGMLGFAWRFVRGLRLLVGRLRKGTHRRKKGYVLVEGPKGAGSFAFLWFLYFAPAESSTPEEEERILAHEKAHLKQLHSLDNIILEILTIFFWCNPALHFLRREAQHLHEFLADAATLKHIGQKSAYLEQLLNEHLRPAPLLANAFFFSSSQLKTRIFMLTHNPSPKSARWRYALILPLLSLSLYFSACTKDAVAPSSEGFSAADLTTDSDLPSEVTVKDTDGNVLSADNLLKSGEAEPVLKMMSPGYKPVKAWVTTETQEFDMALAKGINYMIRYTVPSKPNGDGVVITLLDEQGNALARNFITGKSMYEMSKKSNPDAKESDFEDKFFPGWTYKCTTTGMYKLRVRHLDDFKVERAVIALGFRMPKE